MLQNLNPQLLVNSRVKRRYTKKSEIIEEGHPYTCTCKACDDSVQYHLCFCCLGQRECGHGQVQGHQLLLVKRRSCSEDKDSFKKDALYKYPVQKTAAEHLDTAAAMSCLQFGYSEEMVLSAVNIFIAKYGTNDFKGTDLCEIIFEIEDNASEGLEAHWTDSMTVIETKEGDAQEVLDAVPDVCDVDELFEEQGCKTCRKNGADILSLAYHHVISCPLCTPVLMLVSHPCYGHMWYQSSCCIKS